MGTVNVDLHKKEKKYEELYPLDSKDGIRSLLEDIHYVRESRFFGGDLDASNLLIDFELTFEKARLTKKQLEVLDLLYEQDFTQEETATRLGISQQAVVDRRDNAVERMVKYNKKVGADDV